MCYQIKFLFIKLTGLDNGLWVKGWRGGCRGRGGLWIRNPMEGGGQTFMQLSPQCGPRLCALLPVIAECAWDKHTNHMLCCIVVFYCCAINLHTCIFPFMYICVCFKFKQLCVCSIKTNNLQAHAGQYLQNTKSKHIYDGDYALFQKIDPDAI